MKRLGIASFTDRGAQIAQKLAEAFSDEYEIERLSGNLSDWCGRLFDSAADGIIFVGACGIAVRSIAPFLRSKTTDPAVLVIDEAGQFVISLLSGHLGGANRLAVRAAEILHAVPVITTASDVNGKFAVDVFASDNQLAIDDMRAAKEISAAILAGRKVGFYCEGRINGRLPKELCLLSSSEMEEGKAAECDALVLVSLQSPDFLYPQADFPRTLLHLIPRSLTLGIGCRKGKGEEEIAAAAGRALSQYGLDFPAVGGVSSVDLKKEEEGLLNFCKSRGLPFETYSSEELAALKGEFSSSDFVREVSGVDNVCERAALKLAGDKGSLLIRKQAADGVTVAAAVKDWSVNFDEQCICGRNGTG